jgi:hypothetical protein
MSSSSALLYRNIFSLWHIQHPLKKSKFHGKYAQFLVIYCEGNFRDTVGVWKRYRDFEQLSRKVTHVPENCSNVLAGSNPISTSDDHEILPNAMTSWYVCTF